MTEYDKECSETPDSSWYGVPFTDLDARHWLPWLTKEALGQSEPKLTKPLDIVTDWVVPIPQDVSASNDGEAA